MALAIAWSCLTLVFLAPYTLQYNVTIDSTTCSTTSILCVSDSNFVTCTNNNGEVQLSTTEFSCPTGYVCDDSSTTVCQLSTATATTTVATTTPAATTAATTTPAVTTAATTTPAVTTTAASTTPTDTTTPVETTTTLTTEVTTVWGEPNCNSTGNYPGPTCSEYYECVAVWWWFAPALRTCDTGYYFSQANRTCVLEAESGCT